MNGEGLLAPTHPRGEISNQVPQQEGSVQGFGPGCRRLVVGAEQALKSTHALHIMSPLVPPLS